MSDAQHIDYENELRASEDFERMLEEGIQYIQKLSGDLWTDYNTHDPGITLLEQFCFVLTDLGFRTQDDLSIAFDHPRRGVTSRLHNMGIFLASEILGFSPLTDKDYRKFILGQMSGLVRNCWFPKAADKGGYTGLYECKVILTHDQEDQVSQGGAEHAVAAHEQIKQQILSYYHANRNLCECLHAEDVEILSPLSLTFLADIEIAQNFTGENVVADVLLALEDYVNPKVPIIEVAKDDGSRAYNNAMQRNLFIDDKDLHPMRRNVALPKVKEIILQTPGVRSVKDSFRLLFDGKSSGNDLVDLEAGKYPTFAEYFYGDISQLPPLRVTKDGVAYSFDFHKVREVIRLKDVQSSRQREQKEPAPQRQPAKPAPMPRYQSIQYGLPSIYNVGKYGPMPEASEREKGNARDLRSFLLLFDAFLASQIKQLVEADVLFDASIVAPTYRAATLGEMDVPAGPDQDEVVYHQRESQLRRLDLDRKARVIDHALARLGDRFDFDGQIMKSLKSFSSISDTEKYTLLKSQLTTKAAFLKDYAIYSKWRYGGHNIQKSQDLKGNVPQLKKRFAAMLGIQTAEDVSLTDHLTDPAESQASQPKTGQPKKWRELELPNGERYVALTNEGGKSSDGSFTFPLKDATAVRNFYTLGVFFRNYEVVDLQNGTFILLYRPAEGSLPVKVMEAQSKGEAIDGMTRLVHHLRRLSTRSEGFFCVEHILLQKEDSSDIKIVFKMDDIRLESVKFVHTSAQGDQVNKLLELGQEKNNVFVEKASGGYVVQLGPTRTDPLFKTVSPINTKKQADQLKRHIVNAFQEVLPRTKDLDQFFFLLRDGTTPNWCNNRMTLVFPNWVSRFQAKAFDQMVTKLIHESVPAHIHVQVKKFNIQMMRKFERSYFSWKSGKGSPAGLVNLLKSKDED